MSWPDQFDETWIEHETDNLGYLWSINKKISMHTVVADRFYPQNYFAKMFLCSLFGNLPFLWDNRKKIWVMCITPGVESLVVPSQIVIKQSGSWELDMGIPLHSALSCSLNTLGSLANSSVSMACPGKCEKRPGDQN